MLCNASDSTAENLFGAGYRDVVESDMLSILFGHDEEVGRFGDPPGSALLATVQIAMLLAIVGLLVVSLVRIATFRKRLPTSRPARLVTGSLSANAIVPAALLLGPPLAARASWPVLLYHYRDIMTVLLCVAVVLLAEGVAKAAVVVTSRTRDAP